MRGDKVKEGPLPPRRQRGARAETASAGGPPAGPARTANPVIGESAAAVPGAAEAAPGPAWMDERTLPARPPTGATLPARRRGDHHRGHAVESKRGQQ